MALNPEHLIDVVSIFFMGLLFAYVTLKTGSLLPAVIFHYLHDIFVLFVQNTPGADKTLAAVLLYSLFFGICHWNYVSTLQQLSYCSLAIIAVFFYAQSYLRSGNNLLAAALTHTLID